MFDTAPGDLVLVFFPDKKVYNAYKVRGEHQFGVSPEDAINKQVEAITKGHSCFVFNAYSEPGKDALAMFELP